ncbi:neuronal acetylcholine receptor subunit alpha-6-like [Mizuhopecten yessoensis]|uniref:Neuronal acetylcholine receptor subunit alpha-6 n=1 Tax=Mizuhopecten yessoensis TaxID=6573 RepID=A0A210PRA6_MIZYE|nr:neuronal acetylcholine receptor subunit alpha-6-like [Mizuhopecten yessoensis]OWF38994.1 Neuronal acetylcholine receptor subunit alpha-6 [Mizuhopecten yessoensis]
MFRLISNDHFRATIYNDGTIKWNPGGLLKVKCPPDIGKFTFDSQTCTIDLTPWGYDDTDREVPLAATNSYIDLSFYDKSVVYNIDSTSGEASTQGFLSFVQFKLTFSTFPFYQVIITICPVIFNLLLNPLVFLLPSASGKRASYSLTVLFSFTVFLTS